MTGPFETEAQVRELPAVRAVHEALARSTHRRGVTGEEGNRRLLSGALGTAGVELGAYDKLILSWLAPPVFNVQVPDDLAAGVYSNIVAVWHTPYEFTLDFAVMQPGQIVTGEDGSQQAVVPARVVARVKIPPAQVFELMQALSKNERIYEERIGPIPKPGGSGQEPPLFPPEG